MAYDDIYGSRFLNAVDLKAPFTGTVERVDEELFTRPNEPSRRRAVIWFRGAKKGVVVNATNARMMAEAYGKPFAGWVGQRVELRTEPVVFGGKQTLGLRLYPHGNGGPSWAVPKTPDAPRPSIMDELDDPISF
jgi:hypothetical protein